MADNAHTGFDFFKGFFFGGIVGAVAALLFAPKTGKELREELRKCSTEMRDDTEEKLELTLKKAEEILAETKKKLEEYRKEAESGVKDMKDSAASTYTDGKNAAVKEKGRIKEAIDAGVAAYKEEKATQSKKV